MNLNRPSFEDSFGGSYLLVEPGEFNLGDEVGSGHRNETPIQSTAITDPFFLVYALSHKHIGVVLWEAIHPNSKKDGVRSSSS